MTAQDYDKAVYQQAVAMGIPQVVAQNIVAQARHESGNYTSSVFLNSNNSFGYKVYNGSPYQVGAYNGYAKYNSIQDSTGEVVSWLKRREGEGKFTIANLTTPEVYATALYDNSYYTDAPYNYIAGMKAALARVDWNTIGVAAAVATGGTATLLIIALAAYFIFKK